MAKHSSSITVIKGHLSLSRAHAHTQCDHDINLPHTTQKVRQAAEMRKKPVCVLDSDRHVSGYDLKDYILMIYP
jgi:hypothetical protein